MRKKTLHVRLDPAAMPPVTIVEDTMEVGKHEYELQWVPDTGQSGWVFLNITQPDKVSPLPNPPFSSPSISDSRITVVDENAGGGEPGTFSYSICVRQGTNRYWSDPEIINRGGNPVASKAEG